MENSKAAVTGKVVTGKIRLSYANLFTPRAGDQGGDAKYSACILIPKTDKVTLGKIAAALEAVKVDPKSIAKWKGKYNKEMKLPLRDGDDKADQEAGQHMEYAGNYFFNASNKRKPGLLGMDRQAIIDSDELYSGAYAYVSVDFFAYNSNGNKGIGASLNNVLKAGDGERLGGGGAPAEEDFAELLGAAPEEGVDIDALLGSK